MKAPCIEKHCCPVLWCSLIVGTALILAGCGGEGDSAEQAATTPAEQPAEATDQAAAESTPAEESTTDSLVISAESVNVEESLQAADQATKGKDWTKATDALLKLQISGALKSDQQSWDYNRRMTVLQSQLIEAADNGDARAKAAIELLRKSSRR